MIIKKMKCIVAIVMIINVCHMSYAMDSQVILKNWQKYRVPVDEEVAKRHDVKQWHEDFHQAVAGKEIALIKYMLKRAGEDASELVSTEYSAYGTIIEKISSMEGEKDLANILLPYMKPEVLDACFVRRLLMLRGVWRSEERFGEGSTKNPLSESVVSLLHSYNPNQFFLLKHEREKLNITD